MADNADGESDPQVTFKVKTSGDGLHTLTMAESATVLELKTKIASEEVENIPVERQRLIYSGRVMKNDDTLGSYKIKNNNTIHLVKSAASNHPPAGASASAGAAPAPAVPTNMAAGTPANNLLAGLTGARFAGHVPLPNQDIFGPDGGMNLPSEEQLTEMMSNPAVAQSVNEALNNPSFVDFLLQNNPALRATPNARELIQSPLFRSMLTDPESMRMMGRMRRAMGGQNAFPAPGATDNTPAGAPSSTSTGTEGAGAGAQMPNLFGNPFMPFFNPNFAAPGAAGTTPGATPGATSTDSTARSGDAAATGATPGAAPGAAGGADAAANPWAGLFGSMPPPAGLPQVTPEMMQQAMQMLGGAGAAGGNPFMPQAPAAPADTRPPEERYADQLRQLNDMGFYDFDQNVAALRRSGGSVQGAIQHLLGD